MYKKQFELVEKVLDSYPEEWRKNYYENKKSLKIIHECDRKQLIKSVGGLYDHDNNIITLYNSETMPHELFHMSFRSQNNIDKKLFEGEEIYCDNGVCYKIKKEGETFFLGNALTEGFAEYLSRKVNNLKGNEFEYFITDLLIAIYGEDILKYPLTNDVCGFYEDERFHDIFNLRKCMDQYHSSIEYIKLFGYLIIPKMDIITENKRKELLNASDKNMKNYYDSIIASIEAIIEEYKHCPKPLINRQTLIYKLNDFVKNSDYLNCIRLAEMANFDIKEKIRKLTKSIIKF